MLGEHGCGIAPSTYYAAKTRPRSARAVRDEVVLEHVRRVHTSPVIGRRLYGARKVYEELCREQGRGEHPELGHVPRYQVERLMRANGLVGVRRGNPVKTTCSDDTTSRPPDLVNRAFKASRPNQLWVVDFTYVATWATMAFTAFVVDVFSRRIVGWRTKATMATGLPLDALEMALWTREQANELVDGLVHHSDAGSQANTARSATPTGSPMRALSLRSGPSAIPTTMPSSNPLWGSTKPNASATKAPGATSMTSSWPP